MIELLRRIRSGLVQRKNAKLLDQCGEGTKLPGLIERRAARARMTIGSWCLIQGQLVAERDESQIEIGNNVVVGGGSVIDCALSVRVEDNVLVSYECVIVDSDNHSIYSELRAQDVRNWMNGRYHDWSHSAMAPVVIKHGAWIGGRSIILKGVTVGESAVVGMGSVVTHDVPPRCVVAGNPARVIREIGPAPAGGNQSGPQRTPADVMGTKET